MKNKRQIRIFLIVLGVILFVLVFQLGYKPMVAENEKKTDEKILMQTQVNQLQILWDQKEDKKKEMAEFEIISEAIIKDIPSFVSQEDQILYAQGLENADFEVTAMAMAPNADVYKFNVNFINQVYAGQSIMNAQLTLNYKGTYDQIKKVCDEIRKNGNKDTIQSIEMTFDRDTGKITGTLVVNQYSRIGDKEETYTAPSINDVIQGKDSIFGEVNKGSNNATEAPAQQNVNPDQPQLP